METQRPGQEPAAGPSGAERRAAPRHPSSQKITCYPAGGSLLERRPARVRNVSRTGIGLAIDRSWAPGTVLILELPGEESMKMVRARVIHATLQVGGTFLVGCSFENALSDTEVQGLTS